MTTTDTLGSGDVTYPLRIGNLYAAATINSGNGLTPVTLLTGSPGYYITDLGVQISANATVSGGAEITLVFTDSGFGGIFTLLAWLPGAQASPAVPTCIREVSGPGNLVWSAKSSNTTLSVSTSVALTAGSIRFFARYGLTSILG